MKVDYKTLVKIQESMSNKTNENYIVPGDDALGRLAMEIETELYRQMEEHGVLVGDVNDFIEFYSEIFELPPQLDSQIPNNFDYKIVPGPDNKPSIVITTDAGYTGFSE